MEVAIGGDGGEPLVPELHREAGGDGQLVGLGPRGGGGRPVGAVERQREPDHEELGAGLVRQARRSRRGRGSRSPVRATTS